MIIFFFLRQLCHGRCIISMTSLFFLSLWSPGDSLIIFSACNVLLLAIDIVLSLLWVR